MRYRIGKYLQFLTQATNHHGVHSPFVYNFITQCLYDSKKYAAYQDLKKYRTQLLKKKHSIQVVDFGAGSKIFKSNTRKIAAITKNAGASTKRMRLLYRISKYFNPSKSLELGTSLGLATVALAKPVIGTITSLEGCPETAAVAHKQLEYFLDSPVAIVTGNFNKTLDSLNGQKYDLIYFDGNHSKAATLTYFKKLLPTVHNDSVWIFDDIYWSSEMTEAWEAIKKHPQVQVTIDCFWLGFVFFRKEQRKEHFKIRL